MKKLALLVGLVIVLAVAWYLISPIWRGEERSDPSPLPPRGSLESLDEATMEEFKEEMEKMQDEAMEMEDVSPDEARVVSTASFTASAHDVAGEALLIEKDGEHILRFENFDTINGPNLHIYLSKDLEASDYFDLGEIRATKGDVNYEIPYDIDFSEYNNVLVWCVPFRVLFSYASL